MGGFAWVTLATNDSYSLGALVLAHSLRQVGTVHQLAVLVTPGVTSVMREKLASVFNVVKEVNILDSQDEANLRLLKRPELGITFTKLHCWRLTQFDKCVFLDADTMVLVNADELFDREEFSAAPDVGWPDCFNSGVFVYHPSEETYRKLVQFALDKGSFDGGDQGLLNLYFSDWAHKDISKHLPFIYNMCSTASYSYLPAFKQFGGNVKIIHFIGNSKPWMQYFDSETRQVEVVSEIQHLKGVVQQWWNIFCLYIHPLLSPEMAPSRAPAAVHVPIHPYMEHTSHHYPVPDSFYSNNTNKDNKLDCKNVWDPWEEYENKIDNPDDQPVQVDHSDCITSFETDTVEMFVHNNTDSHNDNSHTHSVVEDGPRESFQFNTNNLYKSDISPDDNCNVESHIDTNFNTPTFDSSNNHPSHKSNQSHTELSFQPHYPETFESYTTSDPDLECNQLARPHTCEPSSSVTNESALHAKTNEVHDSSAGLAGAFARLTLGVPRSAEQALLEDQLRRQGWEVGNIDYMGRDSFSNIWSKICETLTATSATPQTAMFTPGEPVAEPTPAVPEEEVSKQVISQEVIKDEPTVQKEEIIAATSPVESAGQHLVKCDIKPASTLSEDTKLIPASTAPVPLTETLLTSANILPDQFSVQESQFSPTILNEPPAVTDSPKFSTEPFQSEKGMMEADCSKPGPILTATPSSEAFPPPPSEPLPPPSNETLPPSSSEILLPPPSSETLPPSSSEALPPPSSKVIPLASSEALKLESSEEITTPPNEPPKKVGTPPTQVPQPELCAKSSIEQEHPKPFSAPQSEVLSFKSPISAPIPLSETSKEKSIEKPCTPQEVPKDAKELSCKKLSSKPDAPKTTPTSETSQPKSSESADIPKPTLLASSVVCQPKQSEKPHTPESPTQLSKQAATKAAPVAVSEATKAAPVAVSEATKAAPVAVSEATKPQSQEKTSETPKSKSKAEGKATAKGALPKTGEIVKEAPSVQEPTKTAASKPTVEVAQKNLPSPKEVVQTSKQQSSTSDDSPTPPPRKGASGGGAGSKKGGKGKK